MTDNVYATPDTARKEEYENCEMEGYIRAYRDRPRERAARADPYEDYDIKRNSPNSGGPVHQGSELGGHKDRTPSKTLIVVIVCFSLTLMGIISLVVLYVLSQARWQAEISGLQGSSRNYQDITQEDISDLNKSLRHLQNITEEDIADSSEQIEALKRFTNIMPRKLWDIKQRLNGIEAKTETIEVNEVRHNMMSEREVVSRCEPAGCHTVTPTYNQPDKYIDELIRSSSSCRQFIKIKCQGVMIHSAGVHFTYWISRTGEKMYNWGTDRNNYCQCGLNDTCINNGLQCNCDQNSDYMVTSDEGYLTDKSKLPLRELRIGDMSGYLENAWLTIGKLECVGPPHIQIRLSPGWSNFGRVEILHLDTWGTICDDGWGWEEANVICKMLGYYHADSLSNIWGGGSGQIWLDGVSCTGRESSIISCNKKAWGHHNCNHSDDVGVRCTNAAKVILQGGSSYSGRVEIFHSGVWGTVCDDDWDLKDANVVCRMLGFRNATSTGSFGKGSGSIWLDDVDCSGAESSVLDCVHRGFGVHDCDHDEDAGVVCHS